MSHLEEPLGQTQDTLARLHLLAGLRMPGVTLDKLEVTWQREVWLCLRRLLPIPLSRSILPFSVNIMNNLHV